MKKYYVLIALALVAGMTVSCKNNAKKAAEATEEIVEAAEVVLSAEVLATIDELAQKFANEEGVFDFTKILSENLTEEEKLVKPDYLLEAEDVQNLVSRSQRIGALAILAMENPIRKIYGMPREATDEAVVSLLVGLNHPISFEEREDLTVSEKIKKTYEVCKERGDLDYFLEFSFALQTELVFLMAHNPEVVSRAVTDEQFTAEHNRFMSLVSAMEELAKYDDEIAEVLNYREVNRLSGSNEEADTAFSSKETALQTIVNAKDKVIARRNNMLK